MLKKRIGLFLIVAFVISIAASFVQAEISPGVTKEDMKYIMPLSEVRAGMKGYGLTVFKGTKIEKFDVEVIGILRKANNGKDQIFVRLIGGPVTGREANIIQGMSGSPVYVNGKIIGAVAYGPGGFSKEPLAMLTPIEDMLDSLDPKLPPRPSGLSSPASTQLDTPLNIGGEIINRIEFRGSASGQAPPKGTLVMTPLMTPLMVSGISNRGISKLADIFTPYGIVPMAGPGAKADAVPVELGPGSAVGVSLVTGDIDMTGVGTVTYRRGNKLVAFGHPMLGIGPIDAPMTTAWVHDVFPSYQVSFKIASPMKTVGRVFQDRPWSVGGEIGPMPKMIPVTVDVDDKAIGRKRTLNVKIINHPALAPRLLLTVASEAITEVHGLPGDVMATVDLSIEADQIGKIERSNVFFNPSQIEVAALDDLQGIVSILAGNRFHPLDVKSVYMKVKIESGRRTASIDRVFVTKNKYKPGETIDVGVEFKPYKGEKFIKTIQVKVPEDAPDGRFNLRVSGGMSAGSSSSNPLMMLTGGGDESMRAIASTGTAENVQQLIEKYLEREQNNQVIARLQLPTTAVTIGGEKLSGLPDSIANVMKSTKSTGIKLERDEVKVAEDMDYVVTGTQTLQIRIERQNISEKASQAQPQQAPSRQEGSSAPAPSTQASANDDNNYDDGFYASEPLELSAWQGIPMADAPAIIEKEKETSPPTTAKPAADAKQPVKTDAKQEAKPAATSSEKPVGRQPSTWKQTSQQEFIKGIFEATAATDANDIRLVPAMDKLADLSENYVWQVVPDGNGGIFAGTGNNGIIYRIARDGTSSVYFKTEQLQVHSLAIDSKGNLYAGTSPNGKIFQISPDGKGRMIFDAEQKYILALAVDGDDNIYAATGDSGIIYKINTSGQAEEFAKMPKNSVLSLTVDKSGNIYAGTGKGGVIAKITPNGTVMPLYSATEDAISSLAVDGQGNLYAGTGSGKGAIYRIAPSGTVKPVFDKAPRALSLAVDRENNVYVVSDEQIFKIMPDETVMALDTQDFGAQFVSIAIDSDGIIFTGTANMGSIYISKPGTGGTYTSPVHDAGLPARWGRINWIAKASNGTSISLQTRTGNVAEPDNTWSEWSSEYTTPGQIVSSPSGRYIQYRAKLTGSGSATPILDQVTINYLTENRAPSVSINEPQAGAIIGKTHIIKWTGSDPDKDSLIYDLYYSADEGKTWQALGSGLKQAKEATPAQPASQAKPRQEQPTDTPAGTPLRFSMTTEGTPNPAEMLEKLKAELDKHPEIPQEMKDQIMAQAPAAIDQAIKAAASMDTQPAQSVQKSDNAAEPSEKNSTKQTTYNWDTTKVPDGTYMIKVVVSDRASNPVGYLTDEKIVGPITVSNKPPQIYVFKKDIKVNDDRSVTFSGYAYHDTIALAGVQYKVGNDDWMAAAASDGMFDSMSEPFVIETQQLAKGKHEVEVKAIDTAGNSATAKVTVEVR